MIFYRLLLGLSILVLGTCTPNNTGGQGNSPVVGDETSQSQEIDKRPVPSEASARELKQKNLCFNRPRLLNPDSTPQSSETTSERYFRLAYDAATTGSFDVAIANYRKSAENTTCECDRSHALAGEQAAKEAKALRQTEGADSKPTQFFWNRLQELTRLLSCVIKQ